jgi:hypothetical protein
MTELMLGMSSVAQIVFAVLALPPFSSNLAKLFTEGLLVHWILVSSSLRIDRVQSQELHFDDICLFPDDHAPTGWPTINVVSFTEFNPFTTLIVCEYWRSEGSTTGELATAGIGLWAKKSTVFSLSPEQKPLS